MYLNESEKTDSDIYHDFKLKNPYGLHGFYKNMSALLGLRYTIQRQMLLGDMQCYSCQRQMFV